jgi:hypothetical protein
LEAEADHPTSAIRAYRVAHSLNPKSLLLKQ